MGSSCGNFFFAITDGRNGTYTIYKNTQLRRRVFLWKTGTFIHRQRNKTDFRRKHYKHLNCDIDERFARVYNRIVTM